jgi:hypothetical protein
MEPAGHATVSLPLFHSATTWKGLFTIQIKTFAIETGYLKEAYMQASNARKQARVTP